MRPSTPLPRPALYRGGPLFLAGCLAWAGWVFYAYFFSKAHPLSHGLTFLSKFFDASPGPSGDSPGIWVNLALSLLIVGAAFASTAIAWFLGNRIRQWLNLALDDPWVSFGFDVGLGICLLDLFWVGTGLARVWFWPVWALAALGLFPWVLPAIWKGLSQGGARFFSGLFSSGPGISLLVLLGLFYGLLSLLQNMAPETFYDSMVYHLAVPKDWLLNHGICDLPSNFFSNYPYGAETFFLNGLVFQGTESAKMLHLVSYGACALLAGGWAREIAGPRSGGLTLGLVLTFPLAAVNLWTTQVEGFLTLAVVLFAYSLHHFAVERGKRAPWALLAGVFAGLALSTKYTAFLVTGGALVVVLFQDFSLLKKENWKYWIGMLLGALLLFGPWILKNGAFTGNPVFPYWMDLFSGRHLPQGGYERLLQEQHSRVATDGGSWLLLPWTLTMANPDSFNFSGPLALALLPFLFLFRMRHPALRFFAAFLPLILIGGLGIAHLLRFILPVFILFYILLGSVLAGGDKPGWGKWAGFFGSLSAVLCLGFLAAISHFYYSAAGVWTGRQSRDLYLQGEGKITPYFPMADWINTHTAPGSKILVAGDARGLYYDRPFLTNTVFDEPLLAKLAREEKDAGGIARRFREWGVDYLVVNGPEGIRVSPGYGHYDLTPGEWKRLDDFIQRGTEAVFLRNLQGVYRVRHLLGPSSATETPDLLLFFSKPASSFVKALQRGDWKEAGEFLRQVTALYPFSESWKQQRKDFEGKLRTALHG